MYFNWQPVEGYSFQTARQCVTPVGLVLIKPTRHLARKFVVRVAGRVVSRYESSISAAIMRAETEVEKRLRQRDEPPPPRQPSSTYRGPSDRYPRG